MVVEADRVGQIADPALDLERLAHRIVAEHADAAVRDLGQAEHHQDGRGLAGAVRPEQAEDLAARDRERDAVHGRGAAVALGEALRLDDGVAHRRPNLATAPTMISSAIAMMPTPTMPHMRRGRDRDAELGVGGLAARGGVEGRRVVAGDRLLRRRHQRLDFLVRARRDAVDGLRLELDLPAARRAAGQLDLVGRRRAGVGDDDRDRGFLAGLGAGAEHAVAAGDGRAAAGR